MQGDLWNVISWTGADISAALQSGYSVPIEIEPFAVTGSSAQNLTCCPRRCAIRDEDIRSMCTAPNLLEDGQDGGFGACENVDGTGRSATAGTQVFKAACPFASTFSGDVAGPNGTSVLGSCGRGTNYNIHFCPMGTPAACPAPAAPAPGGPPAYAPIDGSSSGAAIRAYLSDHISMIIIA